MTTDNRRYLKKGNTSIINLPFRLHRSTRIRIPAKIHVEYTKLKGKLERIEKRRIESINSDLFHLKHCYFSLNSHYISTNALFVHEFATQIGKSFENHPEDQCVLDSTISSLLFGETTKIYYCKLFI